MDLSQDRDSRDGEAGGDGKTKKKKKMQAADVPSSLSENK
jgi:hypothetical protein